MPLVIKPCIPTRQERTTRRWGIERSSLIPPVMTTLRQVITHSSTTRQAQTTRHPERLWNEGNYNKEFIIEKLHKFENIFSKRGGKCYNLSTSDWTLLPFEKINYEDYQAQLLSDHELYLLNNQI